MWTRGAVAQVRATPGGVVIPFGPAEEPSLVGATAQNTNGTAIAIDEGGGKHVVWTADDGIYYASGADTSTVELVYDYDFSLRRAGPIGRAAVTADANGDPWVAYAVSTRGQEVRVATKSGDRWRTRPWRRSRSARAARNPSPPRSV